LLLGPDATFLALRLTGVSLVIRQQDFVQPEQLNFKDDGIFPNSPLPLLVYRDAITTDAKDPASIFEQRFAENDWTNSWRDGVYSFAHYHSTSHEVLGIYSGAATLRLGGKHGKNVEVHADDVIVIPAWCGTPKRRGQQRFWRGRSLSRRSPVGFASGSPGRAPEGRSQYCGFTNAGERSDLRSRRPIAKDLEIRRRQIEVVQDLALEPGQNKFKT
jgi:uncharacterized protein YjlB